MNCFVHFSSQFFFNSSHIVRNFEVSGVDHKSFAEESESSKKTEVINLNYYSVHNNINESKRWFSTVVNYSSYLYIYFSEIDNPIEQFQVSRSRFKDDTNRLIAIWVKRQEIFRVFNIPEFRMVFRIDFFFLFYFVDSERFSIHRIWLTSFMIVWFSFGLCILYDKDVWE